MGEISEWTWHRRDFRRYAAGAIPALWRRVADRNGAAEARNEFGRLATLGWYVDRFMVPSRPARDPMTAQDLASIDELDVAEWQKILDLLAQIAGMWRPSVQTPEICELDTNRLNEPAAMWLLHEVDRTAREGDIAPQRAGWFLGIEPRTLRAALLIGCSSDIGDRRRFRRCDQCAEWFPLARTDARFCSAACRQAAHVASKVEA